MIQLDILQPGLIFRQSADSVAHVLSISGYKACLRYVIVKIHVHKLIKGNSFRTITWMY